MPKRENCYNYMDGRNETAIYRHLRDDGVMIEGDMKMVWDDEFVDIVLHIPFTMPDDNYRKIFKDLAEEIIKINEYEQNKEEYWRNREAESEF